MLGNSRKVLLQAGKSSIKFVFGSSINLKIYTHRPVAVSYIDLHIAITWIITVGYINSVYSFLWIYVLYYILFFLCSTQFILNCAVY